MADPGADANAPLPVPRWVAVSGALLALLWLMHAVWTVTLQPGEARNGGWVALGPEPLLAPIVLLAATRRRLIEGASLLAMGLGVAVLAMLARDWAWTSDPAADGYLPDDASVDVLISPNAVERFGDQVSPNVIYVSATDWGERLWYASFVVLFAAAVWRLVTSPWPPAGQRGPVLFLAWPFVIMTGVWWA